MGNNSKNVFTEIYDKKLWISGSGPGSTLEYNSSFISFMSYYIGNNNIESIVDFGCGDLQWMIYLVNGIPNLKYTGIDVVDSVITSHKLNYPYLDFINSDIFDIDFNDIPESDLYFIKDVMQHWTNEMIVHWLDRFFENKNGKLITVNCDLSNIRKNPIYKEHTSDRSMELGEFKPMSEFHYPFNQYSLEELYSWDTKKVYIISKNNLLNK